VALLGASFALMNYAFDEISNPALRPVRRLGRQPKRAGRAERAGRAGRAEARRGTELRDGAGGPDA
jgi:peptide/nickel transport system permease protein